MLLPRFRLSVSPASFQSRTEPLGAISRAISEGLKRHRARHDDCVLSFSELPVRVFRTIPLSIHTRSGRSLIGLPGFALQFCSRRGPTSELPVVGFHAVLRPTTLPQGQGLRLSSPRTLQALGSFSGRLLVSDAFSFSSSRACFSRSSSASCSWVMAWWTSLSSCTDRSD
jgi:hypothetical protein